MNSVLEKNLEWENLKTKQSFRLFFHGQFIGRCKPNPKYSFRDLAKLSDIDSSTLSQILRGKRLLSLVILRFYKEGLGHQLGISLYPLTNINKGK